MRMRYPRRGETKGSTICIVCVLTFVAFLLSMSSGCGRAAGRIINSGKKAGQATVKAVDELEPVIGGGAAVATYYEVQKAKAPPAN